MDIVVCVKQVPDTETKIRIAEDGRSIDSANVDYVISPYDEYALEEAIRVKEQQGGEVTVITVGDEDPKGILQKCLAMGCDQAIHISDERLNGSDSLGIARCLAGVLQQISFDIVFFGQQGVGTDCSQVGPMVSELLGLALVNVAKELKLDGTHVTAKREIEGAWEKVVCELPAVVTAQKDLNEPRYPSLRGIMQAKQKEITTKTLDDLGLSADAVGPSAVKLEILKMELPSPRKSGEIIDGASTEEKIEKLIQKLHDEVGVI